MRRAIVNVGVGYWYPAGSERLRTSLERLTALVDWIGFGSTDPKWPDGCLPHTEVNYGFKIWALRQAMEAGYDQALWIDSSCWAIRSLEPVWRALDQRGYYLEPDGANLGEWISDRALQGLQVTRDQVWGWPIPEGKLMGVDFRDRIGRRWFKLVEEHLHLFNGPWTNAHAEASEDPRCRGHRHDISVAGVIARRLGLVMHRPKFVGFPEEGVEPEPHTVFLSQGMASW